MNSLTLATSLRAFAVLAPAALAACGATSMYEAARDGSGPYNSLCDAAASEHDRAVRELDYLRPDFKAQVWSTAPKPNDDGLLTEEKLFGALRAGDVRTLFVQARGGIGKSQFGKALHAEMCRSKATVALDFKDLVKGGATQEAVTRLVAAQLGVGADKGLWLDDLMARTAWILVVDSLDEVQPADRAAGLEAIRRVRRDNPHMQLVLLGRPSIYDQYYGMTDLDAVLEIAPLDCGRARSALLRKGDDKADTDRMTAFVSAWRLDRQSLIGQQCYLPLLATYRDIEAVQRLAKTFDAAHDRGGQRHSLAEVHEAILAERIRKELAELKLAPAEALAAVDKMLSKDGYVDGEWNLGFSVKRCIAAEGGDSARNKHLCEELFQSVVFERIGGNKGTVKGAEWQFSHQALADLFVSRWLEAELAKAGSCKPVDDQAKMFPGKEVAGYLAGRPQGQKCVGQMVLAACGEGAQPEDLREQLRKGLPADPAARDAALGAAKAHTAGKGNAACVEAAFKKL